MPQIFVASDGTGRTAQQAVAAALTQFEDQPVEIIRFREIRSQEQVRNLVKYAAEVKALIVHTLVTDKLREHLIRMARLHNVETLDLMGPLLDRLSDQLSSHPSESWSSRIFAST